LVPSPEKGKVFVSHPIKKGMTEKMKKKLLIM
jgi:hypothetical protein